MTAGGVAGGKDLVDIVPILHAVAVQIAARIFRNGIRGETPEVGRVVDRIRRRRCLRHRRKSGTIAFRQVGGVHAARCRLSTGTTVPVDMSVSRRCRCRRRTTSPRKLRCRRLPLEVEVHLADPRLGSRRRPGIAVVVVGAEGHGDRIDGRAAGKQGMRLGGTAVVRERANQWIDRAFGGAYPITRARLEVAVGGIAKNVVSANQRVADTPTRRNSSAPS